MISRRGLVVVCVALTMHTAALAQEETAEAGASSLVLYLDRCQQGGEGADAARAQTDWDGLLKMGYSPDQLAKLADAIPTDCTYISFRTAAMALARELRIEPETVAEENLDPDDPMNAGRLTEDMDQRALKQAFAWTGSFRTGWGAATGIGDTILAVQSQQYLDDDYSADVADHLGKIHSLQAIKGVMGLGRLAPYSVALGLALRSDTDDELFWWTLGPMWFVTGMTLGICGTSIGAVVEADRAARALGAPDSTLDAWLGQVKGWNLLVAIGSGFIGTLEIIITIGWSDYYATEARPPLPGARKGIHDLRVSMGPLGMSMSGRF